MDTPGEQPDRLPILVPIRDRFDRGAGLRPEVRRLAQQLVERGVGALDRPLLAALDDPYQAEWMATCHRAAALDFWEWYLSPEAAAIFNAWSDADEEAALLGTGHQLVRLLAALVDMLPMTAVEPPRT